MDKTFWYKLLAIGVVLVFIFEAIALGILQNPSAPKGANGGTGGISTTGNVNANVTIVRYEPYLIVDGSGSAVDAAKQELLDSGAATYAVPSAGKLVVNLRSGSEAVAAASKFEAANATVIASATISTPSRIRVEGGEVTTDIDGTSFNMQIRPIYDEGSVVPAIFAVQVENGRMVGLGNFQLLPSIVRGAVVNAELVGSAREEFTVEVPWESRQAAKPIVQSDGWTYREKSFILVQQNATSAQLGAAASSGNDYITGAAAGTISVRNNFSDKARAELEMRLAGLEPVFPPSVASIANLTDGAVAESLVQKLLEANVTADSKVSRSIRVRLPESIDADGRAFAAGGFELEFEGSDAAIGEDGKVALELDFEATGSRLSRVLSVRILGGQRA